MFRKIFKISVPVVLVGVILLISYNAYQKTQVRVVTPLTVVPINASVILQLNDVRNLSRSISISNICQRLQNIKKVKGIANQVKQISEFFIANQTVFAGNSLFISFHQVSAKKSAVLFSTVLTREDVTEDREIIALFADDITTSEYDNKIIYFSESLDRYFSLKDDILFYSDDKMLLTDAIRTSNEDTDDLFASPLFSDCYSTIRKSADINLLINYNNLFALRDVVSNTQADLNNFSEWAATDMKLKDDAILSSGLGTINSSVNNFTDIFYSQKNQDITVLDIIPDNTAQLFAISFNNYQKIYEKKNKILQDQHEFRNWEKNRKMIEDSSNVDYNEFMNEIDSEAGIFNTSSSLSLDYTYTYLKTKESIRASSLLQGLIASSSDYRGYRINRILDDNLVSNLFGSLFKADNPFFTIINDFFIFGSSIVSLEYIIDNYASNNILSNNKSFRKLNSYISEDVNIFFYINPGKTSETLKNSLIDTEVLSHNTDSIAKFTAFTLQINTARGEMLHNLCLFYDNEYKESIKEEWYYPLDTSCSIHPQFVYNHFTDESMILVQDNYYNLIALDTHGEKLWSSKIDGQILENIHFIDTYKNNKFQALYNTRDKLYLIDRNGEFVDGFPRSLPTTTLMSHALIDYDKNKNYRIIIVGEDNKLYNIDKRGKDVAGWKYIKTPNRIKKNPVHFVVAGKDYILEATNNSRTTRLLARNGTERTVFKDDHSFITSVNVSENGNLYALTYENKLWEAYVDGTTEVFDLKDLQGSSQILSYEDGYYLANASSLSYIDNDKARQTMIDFDAPIQTLSVSAGYIAITTNTSLFLIKDNEIIEGFPIDSDGYFNVLDIDNDGKVNVVNIKNGAIYNYELAN